MTTRGLRHIQMQGNSTREQQLLGFYTVQHMLGIFNLSDMFTKEDKDVAHFIAIKDAVVTPSASACRVLISDFLPTLYYLPYILLPICIFVDSLLSCIDVRRRGGHMTFYPVRRLCLPLLLSLSTLFAYIPTL